MAINTLGGLTLNVDPLASRGPAAPTELTPANLELLKQLRAGTPILSGILSSFGNNQAFQIPDGMTFDEYYEKLQLGDPNRPQPPQQQGPLAPTGPSVRKASSMAPNQTFDAWLKQGGYTERKRRGGDGEEPSTYYVKAGEGTPFKPIRYDPHDLEQQYRTPIDTATLTDEWTKFFAGGGFGGGLKGMTPTRQAELVAAAMKKYPVKYGVRSSDEPAEWGLLTQGPTRPTSVFSLLNPQEQKAQMAKLEALEAARGPDIGGKLVLGAILGLTGAGAAGLLGPAAGTFTGAAELGGALGADALAGGLAGDTLAGSAIPGALDYSMTGALSGSGSLGGGLGTGLGTATGASAGAGAAFSALNPFSLATAAGSGLASSAGQGLSSLLNAPPTPPMGGSGASPTPAGGTTSGTQPPAPVTDLTKPGPTPGTTTFPSGVMNPGGAPTGSSTAVGRVVDQLMGKGEASTSDWMSILGTAGATGLGLLGANAQTDALKDIAGQSRADRLPALNSFNSALLNPNMFYHTQPAMGAVEGVLSKLSVLGNPANNPSSLAKAAAYNLGGYNDYLRTLSGPAFGTASTEANLGSQAAGAEGGAYNALGFGLSSLLNPQPTIQDLLKLIRPNVSGTSAA